MLLQIIASLIFGMLPETIFMISYITIVKDITNKRKLFFILSSFAYIICMFIEKYEVIYYLLFLFLIFIIAKILYKDKIQTIDIFLISTSLCYICLDGFVCSIFKKDDLSNYFLLFTINRLLLLIPFSFKNELKKLYKKYYLYWNRNNDEKRPIKSITLRNISLILLNSLLFLIYLATISIIKSL